jgi:hypothetical protein
VPKPDYTPSLARIALEYGTITKDQFRQFSAFVSGRKISEKKEAELLLGQGLATAYQVGLLTLIREYQIIKRKGEIFGQIAIEKGYATDADIKKARAIQSKAFREARKKKLVGDILVEKKIITEDQKRLVLRQQTLVEQKFKPAPSQSRKNNADRADDLGLSAYEKKFLRVKALDEDFSAALIEKGIAGQGDIDKARQAQEKAFAQDSTIKVLGDIMVDWNMISRQQMQIIFKAQGRLAESQDADGFRLDISPDQMAAWIHLMPDKGDLSLSDVKTALKAAGVVEGIYPDALIQCGLEPDTRITKFPVAKKDYARRVRDAKGLVSHLEQGLTETREKNKGDLLAEETADNPTGQVTDLLGQLSDKVSTSEFTIRCGTGVRKSMNGRKIIAAKTGQPALSVERLLYVHPAIHVLEDADQRYGPLEPYANLSVSGTITGAYPVTGGHVKAREIRGARIEAIGNVSTNVGITDAVIRAQGDIKARYLHNCRLELFGNLYVENEIFDSHIVCSGKIDSPTCRVVSSRLFAKQGVILAGTGSEKTLPCLVASGSEHHLFAQIRRLTDEIESVQQAFNRLIENRENKHQDVKRTFEKMIELKIFHDRAKQAKQNLSMDLKNKGQQYKLDKKKNILHLLDKFENRMKKAVATLKDLNHTKKKQEKFAVKLTEEITRLTPKIEKQIMGLEQTLYAYLEWARSQPGNSRIEIRGKAFHGTVFRGVWATTTLESDLENFIIRETGTPPQQCQMTME